MQNKLDSKVILYVIYREEQQEYFSPNSSIGACRVSSRVTLVDSELVAQAMCKYLSKTDHRKYYYEAVEVDLKED